MNKLKRALQRCWSVLNNPDSLWTTNAEHNMLLQLRALGATDDQREALTHMAAVGAEPELIRTFAKMTATGRITDQNITTLMSHGITERTTP